MKVINHEYYVSPEVAKLLKEAGFDWKCKYAYIVTPVGDMPTGEEGVFTEGIENVNWLVKAPTLEVSQKWLREVKNLVLLIDITPSYCNGKPMGYKFVIHISCGKHIYGDWKDTYEESQEAGIKKALELILEKGE